MPWKNNKSCQTLPQVHVCNGPRRWFHGMADCVAARAHKAPRSQTRITSAMTKQIHSRAKSKRRLGRASGTGLLWLAPQKSTSHTQLGTYGPGYFIVPWFTTWLAMCASEYPSWCKAAICPTSNGPSFAKERLRFGIALIRKRRMRDANGGRE